jgi:hypothetical protein
LIGLGWTDEETLVCVVQDGTVYRYNIHGELQEPQISMGKECWEQNVVECIIWGNGIFIMSLQKLTSEQNSVTVCGWNLIFFFFFIYRNSPSARIGQSQSK